MTDHVVGAALAAYWDSRRTSLLKASSGSKPLGRHPDPLTDLAENALVAAGIDRNHIRREEPLGLPGTYNPSPHIWDLVVMDDGVPVAAVEVVVSAGSVGHNFRNRVQDILGRAVDVGRPYEAEELRPLKPCLALMFVLEECEAVNVPVKNRRGSSAEELASSDGGSYKQRYGAFFERLLQDGRYDAIYYVTSTRSVEPDMSEPMPTMGFGGFARAIVDRVTEIRELRARHPVDPVTFGQMLAGRDDLGKVVLGITSTPEGLSAAEAAVIHHRRRLVSRLRALALADDTNETKMHEALGTNYWIFGGQYTGIAKRSLMQLDQHDVPLVCADNSLHVVELKGPENKIVRKYRGHLIVATEVHEAVSQCMNYIRSFDDMGATLQTVHHNELGLGHDYRRVRATVVIGHQDRGLPDGMTREQVDQTIRSYNAHLSRVQVLTWDDLLESAERALTFEL